VVSSNGLREVRLVILFPDSTEIRSLRRLPRRNQRMQSQSGDVWFVSEIVQSGLSTYTVTCVGEHGLLEDLPRRASRKLASDLLTAARRSIKPDANNARDSRERRRRGLWSDDWIERYLFLGPLYGRSDSRTFAWGRRTLVPPTDWLETYLQRAPVRQQRKTPSARRRTGVRHFLGSMLR
jgi:hypothetical protein